jgi:hypothetical protein
MVIVASIYLRFYIDAGVRVRVGGFLSTPNPPKIPSDSYSTVLLLIIYYYDGHTTRRLRRMGYVSRMWEKTNMRTAFWRGKRKERDNLCNLGVVG